VATFVEGSFADVVRGARVVVGLAGTANEQAIGLGKPLIVLTGRGAQGEAYTRMKMRFFGESAVLAPDDPDGFRRTLVDVLADAPRQQRMAAAGRERMGAPGASDAIADAVVELLDRGDA
jgi:uncharacterized protein (TIGR03492 family)